MASRDRTRTRPHASAAPASPATAAQLRHRRDTTPPRAGGRRARSFDNRGARGARHLITALVAALAALATPQADATPRPGLPAIRFQVGGNPDYTIQLSTWHQVWLRAMQLNPDTTVRGRETDLYGDVAIRRSRLMLQGQFDRLQIMLHAGINNQLTTADRKLGIHVHDAWGSFEVIREHLIIGAGLHYWNGISRMSNASTTTLLGLDTPTFTWPTIEQTDQVARQLGIFAHGTIGPLNYRLAANRPFSPPAPPRADGRTDFRPDAFTFAWAGYLQVYLRDPEPAVTPYTAGTWLGSRDVLNVGAGFYWHPGSMQRTGDDGVREIHDAVIGAVDVFLDRPIGTSGFAISHYSVAMVQQMGPGYLRAIGTMNPTSGTVDGAAGTIAGPGNSYPVIGTGWHLYSQVGLLAPARTITFQMQPYASSHVAFLEALRGVNATAELGMNWYLYGHNAKVTTTWRNRPVYGEAGTNLELQPITRANEWIMQLQIRI